MRRNIPEKKLFAALLLALLIVFFGCHKKVNPNQDFFMYVNGDWIKNNPIPATESSWGSFNELRDKNRTLLHKILDSVSLLKNLPEGSNAKLIADFYASGMDSQSIEKNGFLPLTSEINRIENIKNAKDVMVVIAHLQRNGIFPLFGIMVDQDAKISNQYVLYASQGGIGLPNKGYYFETDDKSVQARTQYKTHIANMFALLGDTREEATRASGVIMKIESSLAEASMSPVELRDPLSTYNKMGINEVKALAPNMYWDEYLKEAHIPEIDHIIVSQPAFFKKVSICLEKVSIADWKIYLKWHLIHNTARFLSTPFVNENFDFYGKKLNGIKSIEPRWKRVQNMTDMALGDALGHEYVNIAFSPEAKQKVLVMINNLKEALRERINQLDWMSPSTKEHAREKLNTLMVKIGYPDKWKNYQGIRIDRGSYVLNVMRSDSFAYSKNVEKLGKPVDRMEWEMTPPTINAYYNPAMNEIVFPAGILQAPFYDPKADDALNYGAIGAVIGHELTHGYDDEGRLYDAKGNLRNWWTAQDSVNFVKRTRIVIRQFNKYQVDGLHVNGELTLGENIADLGGLAIAYEAFKKSQARKPEAGKIEGMTPDQRFFIGWARVWRSHETPEATRSLIKTNGHSPSIFRVNGPLSNMPSFYKAFNIQPGDSMMAPDSLRAQIW